MGRDDAGAPAAAAGREVEGESKRAIPVAAAAVAMAAMVMLSEEGARAQYCEEEGCEGVAGWERRAQNPQPQRMIFSSSILSLH